jgi:hypothetical protein
MIRNICMAVALAIAPAGAALAHGTTHHHMKHSQLDNSDARIIDRCASMHFADKVSCLSASRGTDPFQASAVGGTMSTAGGSMSMNIAPTVVALNSPVASKAHRIDAKPLEDLEAAAQRLRDAVHDLAQAPAGPQRNDAIHTANKTLIEVQSAMAELPPEVLALAGNESNDKAAMDRLEMAAQRLRDATHALAREPLAAERADSMKTINKALIDTQQVMLDLPHTRVQ